MGDLGWIPELGRSPGGGNGYPLQYSCLENSMDRGAWQATVCGVSKSQTQLSDFHFHLDFPGGSAGKESTCKEGDLASIPGLGRSPGGGNSYPLQYSGLENSTDCIVYGVATEPPTLSFSAHIRLKTKLQCSKRYNWVRKLKKSKTKIP